MLEFDDGEDFIGEVVEEVVANSLSIIYQKYIERQLLPYTISQAKEALLTIIDWRFLACDPGESDPSADPTWQEDEEPSAAVPDCWAQGSVPKTFLTARPSSVASIKEDTSSLVNEPITEESAEVDVVLDEQPKPWIVSDEQVLAEAQPNADSSQDPSKKEMSPVPPAANKSKRRKFRPKKGRLQSAGVSNMMESLEETERRLSTEERMREVATEQNKPEPTGTFNPMPKSVGSILKFQSGRPPGSRDVYYDEHGNVVAMSRINPDKLPTHRIKTKFHVVDPSVEEAQARLDAMRTGRFNNSSSSSGTKPKKPTFAVSDKAKLEKSSILDYRSVHSTHTSPRRGRGGGAHHPPKSDTSMTPLPPPMIESMELAPGVIVREGDRVKKGPRQMTRTADRLPRKDKLRPVGVEPDMSISVKELLANAGPRVRIESTPVPPIINKHGMNNVQKIST